VLRYTYIARLIILQYGLHKLFSIQIHKKIRLPFVSEVFKIQINNMKEKILSIIQSYDIK